MRAAEALSDPTRQRIVELLAERFQARLGVYRTAAAALA